MILQASMIFCSILIFRGVVVFTSHYCYWVDGHPNIKLGFIVLPSKPHKSEKIRNSEKEMNVWWPLGTQKDVSRFSGSAQTKNKDFHETWKLHATKFSSWFLLYHLKCTALRKPVLFYHSWRWKRSNRWPLAVHNCANAPCSVADASTGGPKGLGKRACKQNYD